MREVIEVTTFRSKCLLPCKSKGRKTLVYNEPHTKDTRYRVCEWCVCVCVVVVVCIVVSVVVVVCNVVSVVVFVLPFHKLNALQI